MPSTIFPHSRIPWLLSPRLYQTDKNYGTVEEMRALVDEPHSRGIRVMLGANINNPGYPTLLDAVQLGFAPIDMTEAKAAEHIGSWSYDDFFGNCAQWQGWYGSDWIRMPGQYSEENPLTATLFGLPDLRREQRHRSHSSFLHRKLGQGRLGNDAWVCPRRKAFAKRPCLDTITVHHGMDSRMGGRIRHRRHALRHRRKLAPRIVESSQPGLQRGTCSLASQTYRRGCRRLD